MARPAKRHTLSTVVPSAMAIIPSHAAHKSHQRGSVLGPEMTKMSHHRYVACQACFGVWKCLLRQHGIPRFRRRGGDSFAKWTTRAALASPLLVLFLWSVALVLHAGKTTTATATFVATSFPHRYFHCYVEDCYGEDESCKATTETGRRVSPVRPKAKSHKRSTMQGTIRKTVL